VGRMLRVAISYVQSQVPKVTRYPVRIQTSLLFVVPRSGGTAGNEPGDNKIGADAIVE